MTEDNRRRLTTLRDILLRPSEQAGWLYLKPGPWTLDTAGFFHDADLDLAPEEEAVVRAGYEAKGWTATLSGEDIEDVSANIEAQLEAPTPAERLRALRYFHDHDAFMEWPE